jgi:hypothetical protein
MSPEPNADFVANCSAMLAGKPNCHDACSPCEGIVAVQIVKTSILAIRPSNKEKLA